MKKRYQIFISSTYLDLVDERQKVINTILSLDQFPAGMELFAAADEEQWQIITETIDASDYYVLIVGMKYGSIFEEGSDKGISYTEKEFDYAISKKVPVLAFIIAEDATITPAKTEIDSSKVSKLMKFKKKVRNSGRNVKTWRNADELCTLLSQSLYKAMLRGDRPGWVRTTEFDIEKSYAEILRLTDRVHTLEALNSDLKLENNRKPNLWVDVCSGMSADDGTIKIENGVIWLSVLPVDMTGAEDGVDYQKYGENVHIDRNEVRLFRYLCLNVFSLCFRVHNDGDARATGVRVLIEFPKDLLTISEDELEKYIDSEELNISFSSFGEDIDANHEAWSLKFYSPDDAAETGNKNEDVHTDLNASSGTEDKFVSFDELTAIGDIANLLDPSYFNEVVSIYAGEVSFYKQEVRHKGHDDIDGLYVLPTRAGRFTINCRIISNEYPQVLNQDIIVVVE